MAFLPTLLLSAIHRAFTILRLLRAGAFRSFFRPPPTPPDKFHVPAERYVRACRLNACVSIVKPADMADPIVLNFYVMYQPLWRKGSPFLSTHLLLSLSLSFSLLLDSLLSVSFSPCSLRADSDVARSLKMRRLMKLPAATR